MLFNLVRALLFISPYLAQPLLQAIRFVANGDSATLALLRSLCRIKAVLLLLVVILMWALLLEVALSGTALPWATWALLVVFAHANLCLSAALYLVAERLAADPG